MIDTTDINWFYINLDNRLDRRAHIECELKKIGITAKRYPAKMYETTSDLAKYCQHLDFSNHKLLGNIGCSISHYELIEKYNGEGILGILEDDAVFCDDFNERMAYIKNEFTYDWDIFFLSAYFHKVPYWYPQSSHGDYSPTDTKHIHRVYASFTTHSYLINPKSKEKILRLMRQELGKAYAIDHLYILIEPMLNCYSFVPGMTIQLDNLSDISGSQTQSAFFFDACGEHIFANKLSDFDYDGYFGIDKI